MCAQSEPQITSHMHKISSSGRALERLHSLLVLRNRDVLLGVVVVSADLLELHLSQDPEESMSTREKNLKCKTLATRWLAINT